MDNITIRSESEKDYRAVEEPTREAFWNVYKPGADEHYYVHYFNNERLFYKLNYKPLFNSELNKGLDNWWFLLSAFT